VNRAQRRPSYPKLVVVHDAARAPGAVEHSAPASVWPILSTVRSAGLDAHLKAELNYTRWVFGVIGLLTVVKLVVAAFTPLAFDEALYWRYSQHLAAGFIDHPFMNPLMIRIGTTLFGQTTLGVRFMAVMLGIPATLALWRAAEALFADRKLAARTALFFNLMVVMTAGSVVATSDQIVVTTTCLLMWALAELNRSGRGAWWLAVGTAFGLGMCSKYTTLFFAPAMLAWVLIVPSQRRWLLTPWPYLAGLLALAIFSPVLVWNAQHQWASFVYQSGRLAIFSWTARYVLELIGAAFVLATPPLLILAGIGIGRLTRDAAIDRSVRVLLLSLATPMAAYFLWHAAHERVQANWIEPIFPALTIAAAMATCEPHGWWTRWSLRLATPFALGLAALSYLEATTGFLPLAKHDPRGRVLAVGWPRLAREVERVRVASGARAILTTDYTVASWGRFYLPSTTPIEQVNQRLRWINEPTPDPALFAGPALYLCRDDCIKVIDIRRKFRSVDLIATLPRYAGTKVLGFYSAYRLSDPTGPTFDPPTLQTADRND
jgi:4-amino-4-deoxy-L-arabinose transferase-like glycosyltransferase